MSDKETKGPEKKFNNKGFTLIEILIALAIFSIGILGVASMQIFSVNYNSHARRLTEATTRGVETLETLMTLPYDSGNLDSGSSYEITDGIYTVSWDVTADPVLDFKTINMTVTWSERGTAKIIRFNYIKSQVI